MSTEERLIREAEGICRERMRQVNISDREQLMLTHIRQLQYAIEKTAPLVPEEVQTYYRRVIEKSKEFVDIALGI